jgi:hypothetical protein
MGAPISDDEAKMSPLIRELSAFEPDLARRPVGAVY